MRDTTTSRNLANSNFRPEETRSIPASTIVGEVNNTIIFGVVGKHMERTVNDGALAIGVRIPDGKYEYAEPGIYVALIERGLTIGRVKENALAATGQLTFHCDNPMWDAETIELGQISALYLIHHVYQGVK